jgi:DNA-binding transcriptional ArsR family regulator
MTTVLELGLADLAGTRFAASPLSETVKAVLLLGDPGRAPENRPWLDWARVQLVHAPLRMPRLWPLLHNGLDVYPEFLAPAPARPRPSISGALAQLRATPSDAVRASLRRVFGDGPWPPCVTALDEDPPAGLSLITAELGAFHQRLIAPHWERILAVLDADIAYRTGQLAAGGARALFADLHPRLTWSDGRLSIDDGHQQVIRARLGPDGIVLIPSVFNWPLVSPSLATSSQTTMVYPARGVATVWQPLSGQHPSQLAATEELIGVTRARLLDTLRSSATTSALAQRFAVTPGAVSQHLGALYRARLLTRQRSGRAVLYQTSELGLALLGVTDTGGVRTRARDV